MDGLNRYASFLRFERWSIYGNRRCCSLELSPLSGPAWHGEMEFDLFVLVQRGMDRWNKWKTNQCLLKMSDSIYFKSTIGNMLEAALPRIADDDDRKEPNKT
eukprot:scaffold46682_cov37-Attheya_sp.AAC.1